MLSIYKSCHAKAQSTQRKKSFMIFFLCGLNSLRTLRLCVTFIFVRNNTQQNSYCISFLKTYRTRMMFQKSRNVYENLPYMLPTHFY